MKKKKVFLGFILAVILILMSLVFQNIITRNKFVTKNFSSLDLSGVDSIMIIAHPDDEIMWGGSHLIDGNFLVVCITAGNNSTRAKEFLSAMKVTNDKCVMLGYPDKTFFIRNNWEMVSDDIQDDLEKLLSLKDWKVIVTHNPEGEYGHAHHIMTSKIVTKIYTQKYKEQNNLFYFGNYYNKDNIDKVSGSLELISDENYETKLKIIQKNYVSQGFLMGKFGHMIKYESWNKFK